MNPKLIEKVQQDFIRKNKNLRKQVNRPIRFKDSEI